MHRNISTWIGLGVLALTAGCAALPRGGALPIGAWSGSGAFVLKSWSTTQPTTGPSAGSVAHGTYPSELTIDRRALDGTDAYRLEIESQRGEIPDLEGDRTHIVAWLVKTADDAGAGAAFYRLSKFGISFGAEPPTLEDGPATPAATCVASGDGVVLQIHYQDRYVDTYHFHADRVYKDGTFIDTDSGLVHWAEVLKRRK